MTRFDEPFPSDTDEDQGPTELLERWGRWLRAGVTRENGSGLLASYRPPKDWDEYGAEPGYRDPVAEFIDTLVAKLPSDIRRSIVYKFYYQESDREAAKAMNTNKTLHRARYEKGVEAIAFHFQCLTGRPFFGKNVSNWICAPQREPAPET